jgi:hypothetical protein
VDGEEGTTKKKKKRKEGEKKGLQISWKLEVAACGWDLIWLNLEVVSSVVRKEER